VSPARALPLPGLHAERPLGHGAFADVHLYRQELPQRLVAVKIMREAVSDPATREMFEREANLLAAVSSHPSIVTIHHAAIAENGRPYLVMEYCSRPSLAERIRDRPLSVPEMLQTMIRLAGAVETAHRAGILHRDIKPANVLTTDYGWPALSDFGISALAVHGADAHDAMSLPWSAPEVVAGQRFRRAADVYALAATAYTLLAGHAPFAGDDDPDASSSAHMARILRGDAPPIARADVTEPLQRLLAVGLARDPAHRPQSASEFGRGLQRIEQDLHLPTTHLDVPSSPYLGAIDDTAEATRLAGGEPDDRTVFSRRTIEADDRTVFSPRTIEADDRTVVVRRPAPDPDDRTVIAARRGDDHDDDRTALSSRATHSAAASGAEEDDLTVLNPRRSPAQPADPGDGEPDATVRTDSRAGSPRVVRGHDAPPAAAPLSTRSAYDPRADRPEAYGARTAALAEVVRTPIAPPTPLRDDSPVTAARSRRSRTLRVRLVLLLGGAALTVAALGAVAVAVLTGGT